MTDTGKILGSIGALAAAAALSSYGVTDPNLIAATAALGSVAGTVVGDKAENTAIVGDYTVFSAVGHKTACQDRTEDRLL